MDTDQLTPEVREVLHLLSFIDDVTGVTLRYQSPYGPVTITVRKTVQVAAANHTIRRFWWATSAAGPQAGEWIGGQPYATAEVAYQIALHTTLAAMSSRAAGREHPD